jgi:hypothetical protein
MLFMLSAIKGTKHQIAKKRIAKHLIQKFKTSGVTINWLPSFILLLIIKIIFIQEYRNSFYFSSWKGYLCDIFESLIDKIASLIDIIKNLIDINVYLSDKIESLIDIHVSSSDILENSHINHEFGQFTREIEQFTREFSCFTREFVCFTREFSCFTRKFAHYTRVGSIFT